MNSLGDFAQLFVALIATGFIGDFIRGWIQRKKIKQAEKALADNALLSGTNVIIQSATVMLTPLQNRIRELEDEAVTLRRELQKAREELYEARRGLQLAQTELAQLRGV